MRAIASSARPGRLVLAEVRLSENAITPYQGQILAAGIDNIRSVQIIPDTDNVIRRHPPQFDRVDGTVTPSFAAELANRAGAKSAPGEEPFLIDFSTPVNSIPAYRVADLYACAQAGRTDVFEAFKDKIVLIGTSLDVEDRHVAANRFVKDRQPVIRPVDIVILRGRSDYSHLHEVIGLRSEMTPGGISTAAEFTRAVELYRSRKFDEAAAIFAKWKNTDTLSAMYCRQAAAFAASPPDRDWNGSLTAS